MIELTPEQLQALDAPPQPSVAVDPRTGQEYLLIRREIYELVRGILKPFNRGWDDPADNLAAQLICFTLPRLRAVAKEATCCAPKPVL
jgi:hypothetical protein